MLEHITDLLLTCLSIFSHVCFPGFVTAISSPSESEIPAAFAKSRCPPSNTPSLNLGYTCQSATSRSCKSTRSFTKFGNYWTCLDITACKEPIRMKLNHFYRPFLRLKTTKLNICNFNRCTYLCLDYGPVSKQTMKVDFLSRLSIERWPVWIGRSDTISSTLCGCLTDRVQRVRPLDSQNEERSVRQRVRPLVDTPGEENTQIGTTVVPVSCWRTTNTTTSALFWNVRPLFDRSSGTVFGLY